MKKIIRNYSVLLLLIFGIGCKPSAKNTTSKKQITDALGRKVFVPKNPKKIIGVKPGALRLLTYVATDLVSGVEQSESKYVGAYSTANPELSKKPIIGPRFGGDAELIIKANPDLVFCTYASAGDVDALQKKLGIPVIGLTNPELAIEKDKWFANIKIIGEALNRQETATKLIAYVDASITELNERTKKLNTEKKPSVYVGGVSMRGAHGLTSTRPFYPPFEFTNAKNLAVDLAKKSELVKNDAYISQEQLLLWNPDIIYIDGGGFDLCKKDIQSNEVLRKNLQALQKGNLHLLHPHNAYSTNYEMVLANAWYIAKTLYPDEFKNVDFDKKLEEILKAFFRKEVSSKQFQAYFKPLAKEELQ